MAPQPGRAEVHVAVSLLLDVAQDEYGDVLNAVAEALMEIIKSHPQEAEWCIPAMLHALKHKDYHARFLVPGVLCMIAGASPKQAKAMVQPLIDMLRSERGEARWDILSSLAGIASTSAEAADTAVPFLLGVLRDKEFIPVGHVGRSILPASRVTTPPPPAPQRQDLYGLLRGVPGALGSIVERHPQHVRQIVPAVLPMLDDKEIRFTASATLSSVAAAIVATKAAPDSAEAR